jgi:hypothetical protein
MDPPTPRPPYNGRNGNRAKGSPGKAAGDRRRTGERFAMLNVFVDFALADLTRAEVAVWLVLYRDTRDGAARTGYDDLARRAGINRRNVGRALRRLESRELVKTIRRGGLGRGVSSYRLRGMPKDG